MIVNMQQAARISDYTAFFSLEATGKSGYVFYATFSSIRIKTAGHSLGVEKLTERPRKLT